MRLLVFLFLLMLFFAPVCKSQKSGTPPSRLSAALVQRLYYHMFDDSADLIVVLKSRKEIDANKGRYRVLYSYQNSVAIRIATNHMAPVLQDSNTVFADLIKTPKEELTTGALDLAANKVNVAHSRFPNIDGTGILASIKEQQFDTTDIDYINRYENTGLAAPTFTTHAAIMATTLAGGANSSPFAKGAAPGALVTSTSFASLLPESDAYYQLFQIPIQNHSYGTVVENYYGAEAAAYDQNVVSNPTLVHVFSAGNSGTAAGAGPYANLQGWSNLTGNFKTAKNILVIGAIDSFYNVAPASSKGPVFDGRIKPDLVAFGEDGSSGAAALTSGAVALLQQSFRAKNNRLPTAALVKAVLLNSADDVGQKGIDYASGYGSLNGYKALQTIAQNRYFEDSVQHGDLKKFTITVPPNTTLLKITLAWTDAPAAVNATTALVNDLDLQVINSNGESWLPWVLSATANIDSITKEAKRQRDTLNNAEQVTVAAPQPGVYTIQIMGRRVTTGTQPFAIAYQLDSANYFEWTFPARQDAVLAAQSNVLRWQTTMPGKGALEYKTAKSNWRLISDTIALAQGFYKWAVPDTLTTAQLRMRFATTGTIFSDTFVISKAVNLAVGFNCTDSTLLFWNALPVSQYKVYHLGQRYLEPVTSIADTALIFKTTADEYPYYSVAPIVDGDVGLKSYTLNYTAQGAGCYFRSFYVQSQTEGSALFTLLIGTNYNVAAIAFQKQGTGDYTTLQTIENPQDLLFNFTDTALKQGVNVYRIRIKLKNGAVIYSETVAIYHVAQGSVLIYPNPAPQHTPVTLLTNKAGRVTIDVFDAAGRLVQEKLLSDLVNNVTLAGFAKGLYLVRITEDNGTRSTQKLVVY